MIYKNICVLIILMALTLCNVSHAINRNKDSIPFRFANTRMKARERVAPISQDEVDKIFKECAKGKTEIEEKDLEAYFTSKLGPTKVKQIMTHFHPTGGKITEKNFYTAFGYNAPAAATPASTSAPAATTAPQTQQQTTKAPLTTKAPVATTAPKQQDDEMPPEEEKPPTTATPKKEEDAMPPEEKRTGGDEMPPGF